MLPNILKSLMKTDAYPTPASSVELVQTHVSWIFLTDSHAFKLKKPVNFGFLDFTSIDRRRFYCNEEVRLNRRLSPDMYEGVVELRETDGGAAFHGTGKIIDYAVVMKRLPADRMLDKLVENGEATHDDMMEVATLLSNFHSSAATSESISEYGHPNRIMSNWRENFEQLKPFENLTLPESDRHAIKEWVERFAEQNGDLFRRRVEQGFIRECDGDLHLENICLAHDKIYIFDCIEFNERFRCEDTAADLAFLLMDLDYHNRRDFADTVLSSYLKESNDPDLPKLIDFYKIYCAVVRGKVESFKLNDSSIAAGQKIIAMKRAISYFRLARGYCERGALDKTLFITCGTTGCGKSSLAGQLAFELGINSYNSDSVRKQLAGLSPCTAMLEGYNEGLYDPAHTYRTYRELERLADIELSGGHSVLIDAGFRTSEHRAAFSALAARHDAGFVILLVTCGEEEQIRRLTARSSAGPAVSDGRVSLLQPQQKDFMPPVSSEGKIVAIEANLPPERLTNGIYEGIRR